MGIRLAGLAHQGIDLAPQGQPVAPVGLGETGEALSITDGDQVGVLPPLAHRPEYEIAIPRAPDASVRDQISKSTLSHWRAWRLRSDPGAASGGASFRPLPDAAITAVQAALNQYSKRRSSPSVGLAASTQPQYRADATNLFWSEQIKARSSDSMGSFGRMLPFGLPGSSMVRAAIRSTWATHAAECQ